MTVTAIPPRTARPRLAPYTAASGEMVLPGCYGVSRGQGITGDLIRHATGPRPGHAFIYIGNGRIVVRALALVGRPYDYPAYTGFALKVLRPRDGAELDPVFKADHWQVCSALVADCYAYAGIRLEPGLRDLSQAGAAGLDTWVAQSA